jgi:AraC-like DNA-binding protein
VISGLETQTDPNVYAWHGRKRLGDEKKPFIVWQYTLAGFGAFRSGTTGELVQMSRGYAFTTLVPSDDFYYLPLESKSWTFFWLIIDHPYIVRRMRDRTRLTGPIWPVPPRSPMMERALNLFDLVRAASLSDEFAEEADLFAFLTEFERLGHQILYPPLPRERILTEVRKEIIDRLPTGLPSVVELAERRGMSRTGFTHYFRRTSGLSPARFINQVRLEEVVKLLVSSSLKLSAIAELTGFADATHLGKVFRRHYYLTPDKYRHVMGGRIVVESRS